MSRMNVDERKQQARLVLYRLLFPNGPNGSDMLDIEYLVDLIVR